MIKKLPLKSIATASIGYTFRGAIQPVADGGALVLQAKDINQDDSIINVENLTRTDLNIPRSKAFLKKDDVLLSTRGSGPGSFKATVFKTDSEKVIAASSVYIIKITSSEVLPEYLSLYLNSAAAQKKLFKKVSGASIQIINRKALEDLDLSLPTLEKQERLIKLSENIRSQKKILERKNAINKEMFGAVLQQISAN